LHVSIVGALDEFYRGLTIPSLFSVHVVVKIVLSYTSKDKHPHPIESQVFAKIRPCMAMHGHMAGGQSNAFLIKPLIVTLACVPDKFAKFKVCASWLMGIYRDFSHFLDLQPHVLVQRYASHTEIKVWR